MAPNPFKEYARSPLIIIPVTVFFAIGIIAARLDSLPLTALTTYGLILFFALGLLATLNKPQTHIFNNNLGSLFLRRYQINALFFLLPIFFLAGSLQPVNRQPPIDPDHIYNLLEARGEEVVITGILIKSATWNGQKSKLTTKILAIRHRDNSRQTAKGIVLLAAPFATGNILAPGDTFLARAKISIPRSYKNPGGIDYRRYLADKGIYLVGWVQSPNLISKIHLVNGPPIGRQIRYIPEKLRTRLNQFIDECKLPRHCNEIYKALLTGTRNGIEPNLLEDYKTSGVMHLLAISGLHVGILAILIGGCLIWLCKHSNWLLQRYMVTSLAMPLTIFPLLLYAMIAGFQPPVVRALVMAVTLIVALVIQRPYCLTTSITSALLAILIFNPTSLFYPSLQLSFAAVISIAILYPIYKENIPQASKEQTRLRKAANWLIAGVFLSTTALIGTLPLTLFYFNRFSLLSPFSTLIISPLLCLWALPIGFLAAIISPLSLILAAKLFTIGSWGIVSANFCAHILAKIPAGSIWLPTPTWAEIFTYYSFFTILALAVRQSNKKYYRASLALFLILIALHISPLARKRFRQSTTVTYLDVGQGSATLFELPNDYNVLIDGGGYRSPTFDIGRRIIAPFLWKKGINPLSALIITHPHADHYNGLKFIVDKFSPANLWINGQYPNEDLYQQIIEAARSQGIQIGVPTANQILYQQGSSTIKVVGSLHLSTAHISANRKSLVVQVISNGVKFLLPGDIFNEEEKNLLETKENLQSAVLLAPHHGSKTSSSQIFLEKVAPKFLVVSADARSKKYPDPQLITYCRREQIKMLRTAQLGAISLRAKNGNVTLKSAN